MWKIVIALIVLLFISIILKINRYNGGKGDFFISTLVGEHFQYKIMLWC